MKVRINEGIALQCIQYNKTIFFSVKNKKKNEYLLPTVVQRLDAPIYTIKCLMKMKIWMKTQEL